MKKYHLSDTERMKQSVLGDRREYFRHGNEEFPCASYLDYYNESAYPWHWHDELEAAFVQKGKAAVFIDGKQYILGEGEGFLVNRRVLHASSAGARGDVFLPNILFLPSLLYGTQESVFWKKYMEPLLLAPEFSHVILRKEEGWQTQMLERMREAFEIMTQESYGYEVRVRERLSEMMLLLCEHREELAVFAGEFSGRTRREMDRIRAMLTFVQTHYDQPLQVDQIADSASVSRRECLRLFRRVLDTSPMRYVTDLRIGQAKRLLSETGLPLLAVANRCGFSDESYFIKVFRERTGVTPAKFRKQRQGGKAL